MYTPIEADLCALYCNSACALNACVRWSGRLLSTVVHTTRTVGLAHRACSSIPSHGARDSTRTLTNVVAEEVQTILQKFHHLAMTNENTLSTANNYTDRNVPIYHDGTPISHDGNDATIADLVEVAVGGQQGVGSLRSDRGMPTTLADDRRGFSADATDRCKRR